MKGSKGMEEAEEGRQAISILGGKIVDIRHLTLPGLDDKRYIITIEKNPSYGRAVSQTAGYCD